MNFSIIKLAIKVLFWLVVLILGAWLGEQMAADPGFMIMSFAGYRVEMAGWLAVALLLVSWILMYFVLNVLSHWRIDRRLLNWRRNRIRENAEQQLQEGLSQLARGDFKTAYRLFTKSATSGSLPALHCLLAAFAAHANGKPGDCDTWLIKAERLPGVDAVLSGLLQATVHLQRGEYEKSLASLNRMSAQENNPFRQDLLRKIYLHLGDWPHLEKVIQAIKKRSSKVSETVLRSEKELVLHQIALLNAEQLQTYWKRMDTALKRDVSLVLAISRKFAANGQADWAEQLIANHMAPEFTAELVLEYGVLAADTTRQLAVAERWLRERPNDAQLLVTLGRLCLKSALWGKAEDYFELAIQLADHPMAHAELARTFAQNGRLQDSILHYEKSMAAGYQLAAAQLPKKS